MYVCMYVCMDIYIYIYICIYIHTMCMQHVDYREAQPLPLELSGATICLRSPPPPPPPQAKKHNNNPYTALIRKNMFLTVWGVLSR